LYEADVIAYITQEQQTTSKISPCTIGWDGGGVSINTVSLH